MKIMLVGNYPPPFGGISVHVQLLYRLLLRAGVDSRVLNIDPRAQAGEEYIHVRNYLDFLIRLVLSGRNRIVHLHTNGHNNKSWVIALACAWAGYLFGTGSVFTIHSGMAPQYIREAESNLLRRVLIKLALAPQSLIVCVNEEIRDALAAIGYPTKKTMLMPAFLFDPEEAIPLDKSLNERLSRFNPLVSLVAFFRPEYGVDLFIEALEKLAVQFPNIGCVIMGSGEGERQLKEMAKERNLGERLIWLGDLKHGECLSVMKASNLFVRPTLADGDSVSVREAVELGVPVVASDVGHRPEGTILFRRGDAPDLVSKCSEALDLSTLSRRASSANAGIMPLLEAYRAISGEPIAELNASKGLQTEL